MRHENVGLLPRAQSVPSTILSMTTEQIPSEVPFLQGEIHSQPPYGKDPDYISL